MESDSRKYLNIINENRSFLRDKYLVKEIGIFGSVARGEQTAVSDVDVLVEFSEPVGFFTFLDLESFLSKTFGKKVDLATKRALKPAVKDQILKDAVYV
ncbi:MAG TPA: nucleotidyltransferase family protein [Candidatus Paceibacterota bacterium]